MTTFTLTQAMAKALLLSMPKKEIRHYLIGAHVTYTGDGGRAEIVSTDGHHMLRVKTAAYGSACDAIVPRAILEHAARHKDAPADLTVADRHATFAGLTLPCVDGKYPDVDHIAPWSLPMDVKHPGLFNAQHMVDAVAALQLLGALGKNTFAVRLYGKDGGPGVYRTDDVLYVCMPVRE